MLEPFSRHEIGLRIIRNTARVFDGMHGAAFKLPASGMPRPRPRLLARNATPRWRRRATLARHLSGWPAGTAATPLRSSQARRGLLLGQTAAPAMFKGPDPSLLAASSWMQTRNRGSCQCWNLRFEPEALSSCACQWPVDLGTWLTTTSDSPHRHPGSQSHHTPGRPREPTNLNLRSYLPT
jgi:hypothetical protein